jgi:L-ascorbate metabolism protein UlaG (beta-lactamase superfamily)
VPVLRLIRNACVQLELGGRRLLVDPDLAPAGSRPPVADTAAPRPNPLVELPEPAATVVEWADAVLVSHLHRDHFDDVAAELIADRLPVFCQPEDVGALHERGVTGARAVEHELAWEGVVLTRTGARHGTGEIGAAMAPVSGFVVRGEGRSVYFAGDSIWCDEVAAALRAHRPDVVVVHAGGARFLQGDPIIMTPEDVVAVRRAAPEALVVAVHLEALNHCPVTRAELAAALDGLGVAIPADGQTVRL